MRFLLRFLMLSCLLAALAACAPPAAAKLDLKGTDMSETQLGGDFSLTDHLGKPRKLSDFSGKVVPCSLATPIARMSAPPPCWNTQQ
jgi:protein SCO1/2